MSLPSCLVSNRLTFDENYVLMRLSRKKPSENDKGLDGLIANPPNFTELKEYLVTQTKKGMIEIRKDFHKKRGETQEMKSNWTQWIASDVNVSISDPDERYLKEKCQ